MSGTTYGPYSPVRQVGDMYYTAGHVGVNPTTGTADPDTTVQATQALENLKATLAEAGLDMNNVVKTTVYVTNMDDFGAVNDVYVTYFGEPRPARSTVGVKALPHVGGNVPLKIEIEAIAWRPTGHGG